MVHRIRVEAFKLIRREQDTPLITLNLSKEVLLLIIVSWCHIPYREKMINKTLNVQVRKIEASYIPC